MTEQEIEARLQRLESDVRELFKWANSHVQENNKVIVALKMLAKLADENK